MFPYPVVAGLVPEAAVCPVPSGSAFHMQTGRHRILGLGSPHTNRSFPVLINCVSVPVSCRSGPRGSCLSSWYWHSVSGPFRLGPVRGLESALHSHARCHEIQADPPPPPPEGSVYPSVSGPVPCQPQKAGATSTLVSTVASTNRSTSFPTTSSSPSDCSRLF